jgi:hypothetical protein
LLLLLLPALPVQVEVGREGVPASRDPPSRRVIPGRRGLASVAGKLCGERGAMRG